MARPKQKRTIQQPPIAKGFSPIGACSNKEIPIKLNIEEFEAIRLLDYEGLNQEQAAKYLKISRPTLTRIYEAGRKKLSTMLVEAKQIILEGGNYEYNNNWYQCNNCQCKFNNPSEETIDKCCICGNSDISLIDVIE